MDALSPGLVDLHIDDHHRRAGLRHLMRDVAQPVVVVTGLDAEGRPRGMTVSSFTSVSLDPPLVLFCTARTSTTWTALAPVGAFAVNVLGHDQAALAARFARPGSGFPPGARPPTPGAVPVLPEARRFARCTVRATYPAGDHDVVVAAVEELSGRPCERPLAYWRGGYASAHTLAEPSCPR